MIYTVIANGNSYDLPSKTISVMESLEKVLKVDSEKGLTIKQKYQKLYDFAKNILGSENVADILNGKTLNDIDVGALEILIIKIKDAYNDPMSHYKAEQIANSLEAIPTDKLVAITNISKALNND